jgi:hypothetical protein
LSWDNTENTHPSLVFSYQWVLHSTKQLSVYSNYNVILTDQMLRYQCNIISIRFKVPHKFIGIWRNLKESVSPCPRDNLWTCVYKQVRDCSYHQPGAKCFR